MRLINTESLKFKEFFDDKIPKYAISSHRWIEEEISYKIYKRSKQKNGSSFDKILGLCDLAKQRSLEWVWIDTCCIDKRSSAELSEAINSMYRWYHRSVECYVYLSGVVWDQRDLERSLQDFRWSAWFTRGWTLQELLAPGNVNFYDSRWNSIGNKDDLPLQSVISEITGIYVDCFDNPIDHCVAEKMSWASKRVTSRIENMAYYLTGLFNVNMPLLYGEGKKAFERLQLEIIKMIDDETIFAWTDSALKYSGLIARWPSAFADSKEITSVHPHVPTNRPKLLM